MADPKVVLKTIIKELVDRTNTHARRLRVLEQRNQSLEDLVATIEESLQQSRKQLDSVVASLNAQLKEQSERLERLEKSINDIVKQLRKTPTASQLKELEEMVEIYNPLKSSFITREQAEELIEERLR